MAELTPLTPSQGLLPTTIGALRLSEMPMARITGLSPFSGEPAQTSKALQSAHGLELSAPNRMSSSDAASLIWVGHNRWLLIGPPPDEALRHHAALSDQSDAWAGVSLTGPSAIDVLSRLTPLDLRPQTFAPGSALRSEILHMQAIISRPNADRIDIMTFRSMAGTLIHDLTTAARAIHARATT